MTDIERQGVDPRMSQVVVFGDLIWLSGQCGTAFDSTANQAREALEKIERYLAEAGSDKSRILSTTIWLTDISDYDAVNEVWDAWIPAGCAPARSCGETKIGGEGYSVEIICVAAKSA